MVKQFLFLCMAGLVIAPVTSFLGCDYSDLYRRSDTEEINFVTEDTDSIIEKYQDEIKKNRREFQQILQAAGRIAYFNKLLAIKYIEVGMFGLALYSLEEALLIEPQNEVLFYLTGISAMELAKSYSPNENEHKRLINNAEHAFRRSIELNSDYTDALLALSVLYIFNKNESDLAQPLLDRLQSLEPNNPHAYALLARVQIEYNNFAAAEQLYQQAAELYRNSEHRQQALDNATTMTHLQRGLRYDQ